MTGTKFTLGQAIDQIIGALEPLDENSRQTVLMAVTSHLGLSSTVQQEVSLSNAENKQPASAAKTESPASSIPQKPIPKVDIRSLKEDKQPDSANQMACLVGYYLQELAPEGEQQDTFSPSDADKYFKQAGYPLPSDIGQVLRDSKKAGYLESVSRGTYKLNAVGYNLVAHRLPKNKAS